MSPPVEVTDDNVSIVSCLSNSVSRSKNKRGRVKRRHSVDFAGDHTVVEIDKADDQSREELWYTKPELESLKQRNGLVCLQTLLGSAGCPSIPIMFVSKTSFFLLLFQDCPNGKVWKIRGI